MGNVKSVIQKPEVLKREPPINKENRAKIEEQILGLLKSIKGIKNLSKLDLSKFSEKRCMATVLESKPELSIKETNHLNKPPNKFCPSNSPKETQSFRLQYGIVIPSYDIAKIPILTPKDFSIEVQDLSRQPQVCCATSPCMWTKREEELQCYQNGYCQNLCKFIMNFNRSYEIATKEKTQFTYVYAEQLIRKGYLTVDASTLSDMTTSEFQNFFKGKRVTFETIQEFFEKFGHFLPTKLVFGGKRSIKKSFTREELKPLTKEKIEIAVAYGLGLNLRTIIDKKDIPALHYIMNIEGGKPEDLHNETKWLGSLQSPDTWVIIKVEHYVPTFELLDKNTSQEINDCLQKVQSQCFIEVQHKMSASFPWYKWCVKARKFKGRCPRSYLDDGCDPIPHEWSCPRCKREIYADKAGYLYCYCRILKKQKVQFCCPDLAHLDATVENYKKLCKKSIKDFLKNDKSELNTSNSARFWSTGDMYIGQFDKGILHGEGIYRWYGGVHYTGSFAKGKLSGSGELWFTPARVSYRGEFQENTFSGQGQYFFDSGESYEGQFVKGLKHGRGKHHFANGSSYECAFIENKAQSKGKYIWQDSGFTYFCELEGAMLHGECSITSCSGGEMFQGRFDAGIMKNGRYTNDFGTNIKATHYSFSDSDSLNGKGTFYYNQKEKYKGPIVRNRPHGQGCYTFGDEEYYQGQFENGLKQGKGMYHSAKRDEYKGNFVNDLPHEYGVVNLSDHTNYKGIFDCGVMKEMISYSKGGQYEGSILYDKGSHSPFSDENEHVQYY